MKRWIPLSFLVLVTSLLFAQGPAPALKARTAYQLEPSDSIAVSYRYTPEYNQTVTVQPDGTVSLQFVGSVKVGGLTTEEAAAAIRRQAGERLLDPEVSVSLKDFEKPHFTVLGEVAKPGRYELHGQISAVDAMAIAGGFKPSAKHTQIVLIHRLDATTGEAQLLDFKKLEKLRHDYEFTAIRDGDLIIVPERNLSKVERIVKLSGIGVYYPL